MAHRKNERCPWEENTRPRDGGVDPAHTGFLNNWVWREVRGRRAVIGVDKFEDAESYRDGHADAEWERTPKTHRKEVTYPHDRGEYAFQQRAFWPSLNLRFGYAQSLVTWFVNAVLWLIQDRM